MEKITKTFDWLVSLHNQYQDYILGNDYRWFILLTLLVVGGVAGAILMDKSYGATLSDWLMYIAIGIVVSVVCAAFLVPIVCVVFLAVIFDAFRLAILHGLPAVRPAGYLLAWWVLVWCIAFWMVWLNRDGLLTVSANLDYGVGFNLLGLILCGSFLCGATWHTLYAEKDNDTELGNLLSSARFGLRHLHVNFILTTWQVLYDIATGVSDGYINQQVTTKAANIKGMLSYQHETALAGVQGKMEKVKADMGRTITSRDERIDILNKHVKSRDALINQLRRENAELSEKTDALMTRAKQLAVQVGELTEQNVTLHQQWTAALDDDVIEDEEIDLDALTRGE